MASKHGVLERVMDSDLAAEVNRLEGGELTVLNTPLIEKTEAKVESPAKRY